MHLPLLHPNDLGGMKRRSKQCKSELERRWGSTHYVRRKVQKRSRFSPPTRSIWLPAWRPSSLSAISHLRVSVAGWHHHAIRFAPRRIAKVFSRKISLKVTSSPFPLIFYLRLARQILVLNCYTCSIDKKRTGVTFQAYFEDYLFMPYSEDRTVHLQWSNEW
jgi:hypothetical protein